MCLHWRIIYSERHPHKCQVLQLIHLIESLVNMANRLLMLEVILEATQSSPYFLGEKNK